MRPFILIAWAAGVVTTGLILPRTTAIPPCPADPVRPAAPVVPVVPAVTVTPPAPATPAVPTAAPASMPGRAGMVVGIDPETGQLGMPTAAQMAELSPREQAMVSRSGAGLTEVRHADGTVSVNLQGRFQEFVVVRFGADGKPVYGCFDDGQALRRALQTPPAPPLEEK
jgi:hypothetical protein